MPAHTTTHVCHTYLSRRKKIRECLRFHTRVDRVTITNPDKGAAASAPTAAAAAAIVGGGSGTHATCEQGTANLGPDGASAGGDGSGEEEQGDGAVHVSIKKEGTVTTTAVVGERGQGEAEGGAGEVVRADAVIVAVPLSVLQEGAVEFDPPLPEVRVIGVVVVVVVSFSLLGDTRLDPCIRFHVRAPGYISSKYVQHHFWEANVLE